MSLKYVSTQPDLPSVTVIANMLSRSLPRTAGHASSALRGVSLDGTTINARLKAAKASILR